MKKTIIIGLVALLSLVLTYGFADAKVSGLCVNCHTMHGYQGGVEWAWKKGASEAGGPYGSLLVGTCLGCHTTDGVDPYPAAGTYFHFPFVKSTTGFTDLTCLAGGFFPATELNTASHAGNAHTIGIAVAPVGYTTGYSWYKGETSATGLTCAGSSGCHGSQTIDDPSAAISGGHHGTSTYGYRILAAYNAGTPDAVDGGGDGTKDYEKALIAGVPAAVGARSGTEATFYHNIYKAAVAGTDTISELCANCHGDFHSLTQSGGAWIRHPSDVALPPYAAGPPVMWEPSNDTVYNNFDAKFNPYGFTSVADTLGTKYVTCLSCHRAHGTAQYDLLRFTYTSGESGQQQAGRSPTTVISYGCLGCHSGQR